MTLPDTIVAEATPPGRGGVAIIRVSGPAVKAIIPRLLKRDLLPRQVTYTPFYGEDNEVLDEGIALFFPNPASFTGEDILELQGHGGPIVVDSLIQTIVKWGARLARPGEFSERAFLNGKLDLTQAEAIADLIDATSTHAARLAMRSLQGEFSRAVFAVTEKVIQLRMYIEAAIDFTDEDINFLSDVSIDTALDEIRQALITIQHQAKQGSFLREGITAVIAGKPNVGKSSLLNWLSGKDLAIVTDIPGTTRDLLRDTILIDQLPMHIIDTAGLRESGDRVEQEGIRRAHQAIEQADMLFCVMDATHPEPIVFDGYNKPIIYIRNKIDLVNESPSVQWKEGYPVVALSVKAKWGIDLLKQQIKALVGFQESTEGLYLARRRHLDALSRAMKHTEACLHQLKTSSFGELAAEDLRQAQRALSEITGEFTSDDLLGRIFSSFCIGK